MQVLKSVLAVLLCLGTAQADFLFDFEGEEGGSHPGDPTPGYTIITPVTPVYSAAQGYGFETLEGITGIGGRTRGGLDTRLKDFMFIEGIEPVFRVDVPNGTYTVDVWAGDMDFTRIVRMEISLDGGNNWILYGADQSQTPVVPLPGTFMTTFADSGSPGMFLQPIPEGKPNYYANYYMYAREFLQVRAELEVTQGHILFRIGSPDRIFNAIEITEGGSTCAEVVQAGLNPKTDLNNDCYVNQLDLDIFMSQWLQCTDPQDPLCSIGP